MKTIKFLALAAISTTVLFSACSENESIDSVNAEGPAKVNFVSNISFGSKLTTRAVDSSWVAGDNIGIFMKTAGQTLSAANIAQNVDNYQYTTATGTPGAVPFTAVGAEAYFPPSNVNVDFISYYPYQGTLANYVYPVNVANQTAPQAIDLMYSDNATGLNQTTPTVGLTFEHQLTKLVFNIVPGTGVAASDLEGLTVTINNMNTVANFNLVNGTLSAGTTPAALTAVTNAAGTNSQAIVLPGDVSGNTIVFKLNNTAADTFTYTMPATTTYDAGSRVTYTVTINRTGVIITGEITNWNDVDGGSIIAG